MRRIASMLLTAWAVSSVFPVAPAGAQRTSADPGDTEGPNSATMSVLDRYDLDNDGKLNAAEKAAFRRDLREKVEPLRRAALREFDWNRNGVLDANELEARRRARVERNARAEARALDRYDADRDGVLSPSESAQRKADREAWLARKKNQITARNDLDQNGVLDPGERAAIRSRLEAGRAEALRRYDTDGDGRLSDAERATAVIAERTRLDGAEAGGTRLQDRSGRIVAAVGGEVAAEGKVARLVIPAAALAADSRVAVKASGVLETGHGGRELVRVIDVAWGGAALRKPATLEIAPVAGAGTRPASELVVGRWVGQEWKEQPGTVVGGRVQTAITEAGRYALMAPAGPVVPLSNLRISSGAAARGAEIGFTLGRAGAVTVRVYDTAGRVTRTVAAGTFMTAGAQTVRWDGTGADGRPAARGLYVVRVQALGQSVTRKLPLVR